MNLKDILYSLKEYLLEISEEKYDIDNIYFGLLVEVNNEYLNVHYIKKDNHTLGLKKLKLNDGSYIQIYDLERTICDIIRDRNKMDLQIFNQAINEYMKRKDKNLITLYKYAKIFKLENILNNYMEVL